MTMRVKSGDASIRLEGEEGWVESNGWNSQLTSSNDKILDLTRKNVTLPAASDEFINFLKCIRENKKPVCSVESGHRTSSLLHCGNAALKLNRKIFWDCQSEHVINDPEADKLRKRAMRAMWSYSKICPDFTY